MFSVGVVFFLWLCMHVGLVGAWNNVLNLPAMQASRMAHVAISPWPQHRRCCRVHLKLEAGLYTAFPLNTQPSQRVSGSGHTEASAILTNALTCMRRGTACMHAKVLRHS